MKTVLNLDVPSERSAVLIDGAPYALRNVEEFSVADLKVFRRLGRRIEALASQPDTTDEDDDEMVRSLDTLCRMIVIAPDEVHQKLSDSQRLRVAQVFQQLQTPGATSPSPTPGAN